MLKYNDRIRIHRTCSDYSSNWNYDSELDRQLLGNEISFDLVDAHIKKIENCKYCGHNLQFKINSYDRFNTRNGNDLVRGPYSDVLVLVDNVTHRLCLNCGWWSISGAITEGDNEEYIYQRQLYTEGVLKKFDIKDAEIPLTNLSLQIKTTQN